MQRPGRVFLERGTWVSTSTGEAEVARSGSSEAPKFSDAALLTASRIARRLLRLVFIVAAARALGPEGFGVYILLRAILQIAALASGSGLVDYLTRETAKDERLGWRLGSQLTFLRMSYAVPLGAAAVGLLWAMRYPSTALAAAAWLLLTLVPRALSESVQGVLRGVRRYGCFLAIDLGVGLTLIAGGCLLLIRGGGLSFVVGTEVAAAVGGAFVALLLFIWMSKPQVAWFGWRALAKRTFVFNVYPLATNLYDRIDVVLLSKIAGDYATGIYGMAYRALGTLQLIPYGLLYSILPTISRDKWGQTEKERLERAMGLLLNVAFIAILVTYGFAGPAVRMILGAAYIKSVPAVEILIWAIVPMYVNFALNTGLLATGHERVFLYTSSVCLGVNLLANVMLIPLFSWRAAAAVTVVTELTLLAQNAYWIRRAIGKLPVPLGAGKTAVVFTGLLALIVAGNVVAFPLIGGTAGVLIFMAYLYRVGALDQFAAIWHRSQGSATRTVT